MQVARGKFHWKSHSPSTKSARSLLSKCSLQSTRTIPSGLASERVLKLIGTTARNSTGKYIDLGVPLRVRLEIESLKVKGTPYRLDFETSEIALYAGPYTQYQKKIVAVPLDVGTYRITVTNLLEASQFQGTLINFHIRQYSFMK